MIEEVFTSLSYTGDIDNAIFQLKCKKCDHEFSVHLNIARPRNCRHMLGKSLTVICPQCHIEGTTLENEGKLLVLEETAQKLRQQIDDYFAKYKPKFKIIRMLDVNDMHTHMHCFKCKTVFEVRFKPEKINVIVEGDKTAIKCPNCKEIDDLDEKKPNDKQIADTFLQLRNIEKEIKSIKESKNEIIL